MSPTNANDSFFTGQTCATLKDRVFSPSSGKRHATEICEQIHDMIGLDKMTEDEILVLLTDGGSDHNVTAVAVQVKTNGEFVPFRRKGFWIESFSLAT